MEWLTANLDENDIEIIAVVTRMKEAVTALRPGSPNPDLILCDAKTFETCDPETSAKIAFRFPNTGIVVLGDQVSSEAINANVRAFLPISVSSETLKRLLELAALGETIHPVPRTKSLVSPVGTARGRSIAPDIREALDSHEAQIVDYLKAGTPSSVIARELGVSEKRIQSCIDTVLKKIQGAGHA